MKTKLVEAFEKVIWNWADLNPDDLPYVEGYLLAKGRNPAYWQINPKEHTHTEYNRLRKQRERERPTFDSIVRDHWRAIQTPAEVSHKMSQQLTEYCDMMHTGHYERTLRTYLDWWHFVTNLPAGAGLPSPPKIVPVSQIYTSLMERPATPQSKSERGSQIQHRPTRKELAEQPELVANILQGVKPRRSRSSRRSETDIEQAHHHLRNMESNERNNTLRWLRKGINEITRSGQSLEEFTARLYPECYAALTHAGLSLSDLLEHDLPVYAPHAPVNLIKSLPLFSDGIRPSTCDGQRPGQ